MVNIFGILIFLIVLNLAPPDAGIVAIEFADRETRTLERQSDGSWITWEGEERESVLFVSGCKVTIKAEGRRDETTDLAEHLSYAVSGTSILILEEEKESSSCISIDWNSLTAIRMLDQSYVDISREEKGVLFTVKAGHEHEGETFRATWTGGAGDSPLAKLIETLQIFSGTYTGEVVAGRPHGQGTWTHPDGHKYIGEWKDSKKHGQGTRTFADGTKYVGEYKDGKRWEGIQYSASGEILETFSNGEWCTVCEPTARQLAKVGEIDPSLIATTATSTQSSTITQTAQTTTPQPTEADKNIELEFWQSIQNSNDPDMYREYLRQFPSGVYAGLAELKIKKLGSDSAVATTPNLDYGNYHALVIGNNRYRNFTDLNTPINDARTVASVLESKYGFKVNTLENATESKIFKAIVDLRSTVGRNDNVLIYYGGHGDLDNVTDEGFWIPSDAREDDPSTYLAVDRIRKQIKAMPAKHVMVVADSCFAGSLTRTTLTRALKVKPRSPEYHSELQRISNKKSRTALTSGGLEPVLDSGSDGHSVFAGAFISALENNDGVLDAHMLFIQVRDNVRNNSSQNPEYSPIYETGHDGGDFLFVRH
jgi:uncharacterized caspase-like protein